MRAEDLIGTWRLRSAKNYASDGTVRDAFGAGAVGYIFYNAEGYVSVEILPDADAPAPYLSYAGPFEVRTNPNQVFHHVEVCAIPGWVGNPQIRNVTLDGDVLTLSTDTMVFDGTEHRGEVVWERVRRA